MAFTDFTRYCEEGVKVCKELILGDSFNRVVVSGVGFNSIPGYIIDSLLKKNKIPVVVTEDYADPDIMNYRTLVIMISKDGDEEQVLSHYRIALRNDCKMVIFNQKGKLRKLYERNRNVVSFNFNNDMDFVSFVGFCLFGSLYLLRNANVFSDTKNELQNSLNLIKSSNISNLGFHLAKRIDKKTPIVYTTRKMIGVSKTWKVLFNTEMKRHLFYGLLPNATYSDYHTYENGDPRFFSIIIKDQEDPRLLKDDIEILKNQIKRNGLDVIEIGLTGNFQLLRYVSAFLICVNCIEHLKIEDQKSLEEYE